MNKFKEIRPIVLGIARRDNKILVSEGYDKIKKQTFYRCLGGGIEFLETSQIALKREYKEELGIDCMPEWLGVARFELQPDYFSNMVREEYGAIYGISLPDEYLDKIERWRIDREEIEKIALLSKIPSDEEIRDLDRKLTEFY